MEMYANEISFWLSHYHGREWGNDWTSQSEWQPSFVALAINTKTKMNIDDCLKLNSNSP
jgi:hypothetical protein